MSTPAEILEFWFGAPDSPAYGESRPIWFDKDPGFDMAICGRFRDNHTAAAAGRCDAWAEAPASCLALVLVLDQFSRHLYRGDPRAWAADAKARAVARQALDRGFHRGFPPHVRKFFYLPFEHSEVLSDQYRSVALFATLELPLTMQYAYRHWEIIHRFGRFPHRNAVLGRESTAEELAFLQEPFSSF